MVLMLLSLMCKTDIRLSNITQKSCAKKLKFTFDNAVLLVQRQEPQRIWIVY